MNSQKYNLKLKVVVKLPIHWEYLLLFFAISFVSSCVIGPDYNKITFEIPDKFKETENEDWKIAEPKDDSDKGKWWEIYEDPILNEFEEKLDVSNQTIASAIAQYEQAQALVGQAQAKFFPTINGVGGVTRQRQQASGNSSATQYTNNSISLGATWIPDLWGSVRRTVESSKAGEQASAAQLANVKLTAQASLAQYYFQLRIADIGQKLLDDTVDNYKKALEIIEHLRIAGTATLTDHIQAETQLNQAQALALDNKITRAQYEHAIAILLGKAPSQFALEPKQVKMLPPEIPLELPSELLERRPDVAQAERLVAQANAQIGVAKAAYFPDFNLSANGGYSSNSLSKLLTLPSLFWSLGANLSEIIFDGGLRDAKIDAAKANYKVIAAQYRQTVLVAFQNVEDNLIATNILKKEEEAQRNTAANAQQVENLITHGYEVGTQTYSDVINAQTSSFSAKKAANEIMGRRMTTSVSLIAALGGGWKKEDKKKESTNKNIND